MRGILGLLGSGEFSDSMLETDELILSKMKNPKVAILPTASGKGDYRWFGERGVEHFQKLGVEVKWFEIINRDHANNPQTAKELKGYNFFYFSGGDPGYLLDNIKNTIVWQTILKKFENGATLMGSSAGAMVFGRKVYARVYETERDRIPRPWEEGLNIVGWGLIPHYDLILTKIPTPVRKVLLKLTPKDIDIMGIDENTSYVNFGDGWQIFGEGSVRKIN